MRMSQINSVESDNNKSPSWLPKRAESLYVMSVVILKYLDEY